MSETEPAAMARCEVTGAPVPEDELVTIQGQRVCAEGKRILLERLKAGESLSGALERAGVLARLGAILIDAIGLFIFTLLATAAFAVLLEGTRVYFYSPRVPLVIMQCLWLVMIYAYFGLLPLVGGQTLGKMYCRIMIRNADGSPLRWRPAMLRGMFFLGLNLFILLTAILSHWDMVDSEMVGIIAMIIAGWYLSDAIVALLDRGRQRSLHDRIAGTRVVLKD